MDINALLLTKLPTFSDFLHFPLMPFVCSRSSPRTLLSYLVGMSFSAPYMVTFPQTCLASDALDVRTVLLRHFVECPLIWSCWSSLSWLDWVYRVWGGRSRVTYPSRHITRDTVGQLMLAQVSWQKECFPRFSTIKPVLPPTTTSRTVLIGKKSLWAAHL